MPEPNLLMMLYGLYASLTYCQSWKILNQLTSPKVLCDMYALASTSADKNIILMLITNVALFAQNEEDIRSASQFHMELMHNNASFRGLGDEFHGNPSFYNMNIQLRLLVAEHANDSRIDNGATKEALEMFRTSFLVWKFP
jgi:hypothetical protein